MPREIPFDFVLEELASKDPYTKPMFGCTSVYIGNQIVLILRNRQDFEIDNGVWLATTEDHHSSLKKEFPNMRSISVFGTGVTGWQVLPVDAADFENSVLHACHLIRAMDPRIGKVPKSKLRSKGKKKRT